MQIFLMQHAEVLFLGNAELAFDGTQKTRYYLTIIDTYSLSDKTNIGSKQFDSEVDMLTFVGRYLCNPEAPTQEFAEAFPMHV